MTVEMTRMKMDVVPPVLLRKAGVAGKTPWLKTLIGLWELALIRAYDLLRTTHLETNMVGFPHRCHSVVILLSSWTATGELRRD